MNRKRRHPPQELQDDSDNDEDMYLDPSPGPSTRNNASKRSVRYSQSQSQSQSQSLSRTLHNMDIEDEEEMQLTSTIIKYLLVADREKQPIQRSHIVKNVLNGDNKLFRSVIDKVKRNLSGVFGYNLVEVENNKYILVNEIENPYLNFKDDKKKQVLLFLVLVHIFMLNEPCKEEMLWDYLCKMDIITPDNFIHDYFGDVNHLVTVEFVNQKYLTAIRTQKNNASQVEYVWGPRAIKEVTYMSALEFVAQLYGTNVKQWKFHYKIAMEEKD